MSQGEPLMPSRCVLVVEDDPDLRDMTADVLRDEGYEVRLAEDGAAALALLRRCQPDLILLDLMMPRLDGWSFRKAQLADPTLASIPVIVLSAAFSVARDTSVLQASAVLTKPYDLNQMLDLIAQLVGRCDELN
jgi:CheY-like chemotaxis protein